MVLFHFWFIVFPLVSLLQGEGARLCYPSAKQLVRNAMPATGPVLSQLRDSPVSGAINVSGNGEIRNCMKQQILDLSFWGWQLDCYIIQWTI